MKYQKHTGKRDNNIEQTARLLWMCGLCYNREIDDVRLVQGPFTYVCLWIRFSREATRPWWTKPWWTKPWNATWARSRGSWTTRDGHEVDLREFMEMKEGEEVFFC